MTNEQKREIAKLFWKTPGYSITVSEDERKFGVNWEAELPAGTLTVLYKTYGDDLDYDTVCYLIPEDPKDKRIRELEEELAALRSKEPLYDPSDMMFMDNPRGFVHDTGGYTRHIKDAVMDDFPAGPEVTCSEDDGA